MKHVRVFFASLSGFGTFSFSKTNKENQSFGRRSREKIPTSCSYEVNYNSRLLETMQNHKTDLENLFITIIENDSNKGSISLWMMSKKLLR
jgi:hypothetical protein